IRGLRFSPPGMRRFYSSYQTPEMSNGGFAMSKTETMVRAGKLHTKDYLAAIGVPELAPSISPFDPGYDPATLQSHLEQSAHLMSILKISMACWMVAKEAA